MLSAPCTVHHQTPSFFLSSVLVVISFHSCWSQCINVRLGFYKVQISFAHTRATGNWRRANAHQIKFHVHRRQMDYSVSRAPPHTTRKMKRSQFSCVYVALLSSRDFARRSEHVIFFFSPLALWWWHNVKNTARHCNLTKRRKKKKYVMYSKKQLFGLYSHKNIFW